MLRRWDRDVGSRRSRRLADDFCARDAADRLVRVTAGRGAVALDHAVGDYDVFFLPDFDETHGGGLPAANEIVRSGVVDNGGAIAL